MKFHNFHQGCCGYNPTRSDGSEWAHVVSLPDGSSVFADTAGEALEEIIDGYAGRSPDAHLGARIRHAQVIAPTVQASLIDQARRMGILTPGDDADEGLLQVLRLPKSTGFVLEDPAAPGQQAPWTAPVPLVLVTTHYAPGDGAGDSPGERPAPIPGNVHWLDPSNAETYLASLAAVRYLDHWSADTPSPARA